MLAANRAVEQVFDTVRHGASRLGEHGPRISTGSGPAAGVGEAS